MSENERKPTGPGPQANTPDAGSTEPKDKGSSGDFAEGADGRGYVRDDYGDYGEKRDTTRDDDDLEPEGKGEGG